MDWLTFVSNVIRSIAWPAALVILLLYFHDSLSAILKRVVKAKGFGGEMEFAAALEVAEQQAPVMPLASASPNEPDVRPSADTTTASEPPTAPTRGQSPQHESDVAAFDLEVRSKAKDLFESAERASELANSLMPPAYIVLSSWKEVERVLWQAINKGNSNAEQFEPVSINSIVRRLNLPHDLALQINDLRKLRNKASHGMEDEITLTDGLRYRDLTKNVLDQLAKILPPL